MSRISEEYLKILKELEENISNEEERNFAIKKFGEMAALYLDIIERMSELNNKNDNSELEKKVEKLAETVNLIKGDIYEQEGYDFEIVCPYCGHEFVADVEAELKENVECPECHKTIELDWGEDEEEGCSGNCSGCSHFAEEFGIDASDEDDDM